MFIDIITECLLLFNLDFSIESIRLKIALKQVIDTKKSSDFIHLNRSSEKFNRNPQDCMMGIV